MQRLIAFTCLFLCSWLVSADLTLEVLDPTVAYQTGARCLDGSPASFHFEQGAETKKWVIYVQGGGSCDTQKSCKSRSQDPLGSSLKQPLIVRTDTVASNNPIINPGFWNWTHVRLDYCSGDRWAGTRVNASADSWGYYFAGRAIFKALIDHLIAKYRLDLATEIFVHGGSAGAYGAMTNIDYLNSRLQGIKISLAMDSGWAVDFFPAWSGDGVEGEIRTAVQLYQSYINQACAAANPNNLTACFFPRYIFPYIPNRVFILNSLLDKVELATLGFPDSAAQEPNGSNYLTALGEYTKLSILTEYTRDPRVDGLFITTCPEHIIDVAIQGTLSNVAQANWYYRPKSSSTPAVNYDNCAIESVVSLLKANISLFDDCPTLMQLCTKNTNSNTPNVFEQVFNNAASVVNGSDSPVASVTTEPVDNNTTSTASVVSVLTVMAVIMIAAGLL